MKKLFSLLMLYTITMYLHAQQDIQSAAHQYIPQIHQVAYCGTEQAYEASLLYSNQWNGIEGNPKTILFSGNSTIGNTNLSAGTILLQEKTGISVSHSAEFITNYSLKFPDDKVFSFGLGASIKSMNRDLSSVAPEQLSDPVFIDNSNLFFYYAIRIGTYYKTNSFRIGFTADGLNKNKKKKHDYIQNTHYYLTSGYTTKIYNNNELLFDGLLKYEPHSPISADFYAAIANKRRVYIGLSYRLENYLGANCRIFFLKNFYVGTIYEASLNVMGDAGYASNFEFSGGFKYSIPEKKRAKW